MKYYYNPLDKQCKNPVGAFSRHEPVTFNIYHIREQGDEQTAEVCNLILYQDGHTIEYFQMNPTDYGWTLSVCIHDTGLYFYYFKIGGQYLACGNLHKGTMVFSNPVNWQLTVYDEAFHTPQWFKGGIMYQIFPDRFCKEGDYPISSDKILREWGGQPYFRPNKEGKILNNDFFGGNLNGVRKKLGYLQSLGVSTIYFNPIFEAYSNHRYDTADYHKIDPLLGTEEDFDALISEAEAYGIHIILDGVFNHTGSDSRYFNKNGRYSDVGAYQSPQSPYYDWYSFRGNPDLYDSWWGIDTLPAINERSASYQEFIFGENGVLKKWLRHGIGGYRLDVADELPDFFLEELRKTVKEENPEALILGEVWEDASNKIAYGERRKYFQGRELDSVMNYPLKDAIIQYVQTGNLNVLRETIALLIDHYPKCVLDSLMNILGTHDTYRILTVLGGKQCGNKEEMAITRLSDSEREEAKEKLKMAAVLQFTLPGVPCIYYGDEAGMEGYSDPFCRQCFNWNTADNDLTAFFKRLGEIRRKELTLIFTDGIYREVYANASFLLYERKSSAGSVYVFTNCSSNKYTIQFQGVYREYISQKDYKNTFVIDGNSYGILAKI